ncbi:hypothetical protein [Mesorhizobium sp. Z1-4]|uniref:hypothetical protein n=1 Tax=Mesorhizobium sp. Z1-4 TaxID=2448478 RepID=UPI000FDA3E72|nr:hypothetical protein [Mesorhizobium sp. Z1-4]
MSAQFDECLRIAVAAEEIDQETADTLRARYDELRATAAAGSEATADAEAKRLLAELLKAEAEHEKRKAALSIRAVKRISIDLGNWKNAKGENDVGNAALDLLENFGTAGFSSVAGRSKAILGQAHAKMAEALHHFRRGAFGGDKTRWNAGQLGNVVREAFGEDTGDLAAKGLATTWRETAEWLRQRFNKAGGAIGRLDDWGLPQHHDARALKAAGREVWKEAIRPKLDLTRMQHPLTGGRIGAAELERMLDAIYDRIVTDGWIDRKPTLQRFGTGALANQHAEHRVLVFKSADDWLGYQRDFGGADPFAAMMGYLNVMSRDIGAMEILGPNPDAMIEFVKQFVMREAQLKAAGKPARFGGKGDPIDRARGKVKRLSTVWSSVRGQLNTPVNSKAANALGAARAWLTAGMLGQAAISAISDIGYGMAARSFAGLPAHHAAGDLFSAFRTATRREAVEAGLILDAAAHVFQAQARYVGTLEGPEWPNYLADRVLTYSGLTPWTQAGRHAFGLAMQVEFGKRTDLAFAAMPDALKNTLTRYGISQRDWELIRKASLHRRDGAAMLRPAEIAKVDENLAERYLEMILMETEYAVPSSSHRTRSALLDQNQPGTLWGEVLRSFAQFKAFGSAVIFLHGARTHRLLAQRGVMKGAAYAGSVLFSTTLVAGLALQLKQIAAGRDPRDMQDPKFWTAAMLQGGGLGIYGDFMFAELNRYGGGLMTTLGGPLFGKANDFRNLTAGNAVQLASDDKTHFGRELIRFSKGLIPGGNLWYLKLGFERTVLDQLQWLADPEAADAFKRQQKYWSREYGQDYFWKPGRLAPDRAPQLTR